MLVGKSIKTAIFKKFYKNINLKKFQNVEKVHNFGYYIGNYPVKNIIRLKDLQHIK